MRELLEQLCLNMKFDQIQSYRFPLKRLEEAHREPALGAERGDVVIPGYWRSFEGEALQKEIVAA